MKRLHKTLALIMSLNMMFSAVMFTGCKDKNSSDSDTSESQTDEKDTTEITDTTTEKPEKKSTKKSSENDNSDIDFSLKNSNSWTDGNETIYQLDGVITNKQQTEITDWRVSLTVSENITLKNSWGMSYDLDGTKMTITPDQNTGKIPPNGSVNFGLQIASPEPVDVNSAVFTSESSVLKNQNSDNSTDKKPNSQNKQPAPAPAGAKDVPAPDTDDWLSVKKNKIVDSDGTEVWLTGCNWFGYNTGTNIFDGLWAADLNTSIAAIADHGFNLLRIPISTELVNQWEDGNIPDANFNQATNSYLTGMNSLEIFDYVIGQCRANGIKIMIDFHCASTDASGHVKPMWYDEKISEKDYIRGLEWIADRYKNDDTIIAIDLENEPHGKQNESPRAKWDGSKDPDNWKYIAEKAGLAVLGKNPNLLIMVEGIEIYPKDIKKNGGFTSTNADDYFFNWWGGNLRGVKDNPVDLGKYNDKLVYSPHDYGPTVYEQPWFSGHYNYDSLMKDCWKDNWFYIYENKTAPLLIGEWGGYMTEPNITWMTYCRELIKKYKLHHTFWCFNANSGDTGGLVLDDFTTWDEEKYSFVKEVLWQNDSGSFIGLDHKIPLGKNGINLSDYEK